MIPDWKGREILHKMALHQFINWQEVPRTSTLPLNSSHWLYYVDPNRVEQAILQSVMQAVLNLRVRFRVESAKIAPLVSRGNHLTAQERSLLHEGFRTEDILERSFLVLNTALVVLR